MNNKYCEFQGTIQGDTIAGKSWNVRGGKWDLRIQRVTDNK